MRQLLTYWPPRIVSAKWTFQLSRSSTLASAAGDAALGHHGVRLAEQRLADSPTDAGRRRLDRRAQARAAGADDEHVVLVRRVTGHQRILQSVHAHRAQPDVEVGEARPRRG